MQDEALNKCCLLLFEDPALEAPQKGSIDSPPQNPAQTDPRAPEVTQGTKIRQNMKMGFWNQRVERVQKRHHLPCIW